jgi:transcriptional regulator with XRE-family HTH domain
MSQDDLAFEARAHGAPSTFTGSWISQLKLGKRPLHVDVLAGMAGALGISPETFAEYRLALARRQLDEGAVGLEEAVANLNRVNGALDATTDDGAEELVKTTEDELAAAEVADGTRMQSAGRPGERDG